MRIRSTPMKQARTWTKEEDGLLREAVARQGETTINWHEVASFIDGRNNKECRKRWVYALEPSINKGSWEPSEDERLRLGVQAHGTKWAEVSRVVGSRHPDQCSKRWHEVLKPNINRDRWSLAEKVDRDSRTLLSREDTYRYTKPKKDEQGGDPNASSSSDTVPVSMVESPSFPQHGLSVVPDAIASGHDFIPNEYATTLPPQAAGPQIMHFPPQPFPGISSAQVPTFYSPFVPAPPAPGYDASLNLNFAYGGPPQIQSPSSQPHGGHHHPQYAVYPSRRDHPSHGPHLDHIQR